MNLGLWAGLLLVALVGCEGWPLYSELPTPPAEEGTLPHPTGQDVAWLDVPEAGSNGDSRTAQRGVLTGSAAFLITGTFDGLGWDPEAVAPVIADPDCGSSGSRAPDGGDYTGDVDFFLLDVERPGRLCAALYAERDDLTVDLLLFGVDACAVPGPPVRGDGGTLGAGLAADDAGWEHDVGEAGWAVMVAAPAPDDDEAVVAYQLAVALVSEGAPCPAVPGQAPR